MEVVQLTGQLSAVVDGCQLDGNPSAETRSPKEVPASCKCILPQCRGARLCPFRSLWLLSKLRNWALIMTFKHKECLLIMIEDNHA